MFFLPKSNQFFDMLNTLAACGVTATELLDKRFQVAEPMTGIQEAKYQAQKTINLLTDAVCKTFVTPFDREDIQSFAFHLYRIIKIVDKINQRASYRPIDVNLFKDPNYIIHTQANHMLALVETLAKHLDAKLISDKAQRIHELEHQSDRHFHEALRHMCQGPPPADMRDFLLQKDLLQQFDKVADTYRDAANLALQIVLKHS